MFSHEFNAGLRKLRQEMTKRKEKKNLIEEFLKLNIFIGFTCLKNVKNYIMKAKIKCDLKSIQ